MNEMGFTVDGLGNHNFDRGQAYLRNTLIPKARFPYVSANIVDASFQALRDAILWKLLRDGAPVEEAGAEARAGRPAVPAGGG